MNIEKAQWNSSAALEKIRRGEPVVLIECPICYPSAKNWTLEHLANIIHPDFPCDVFESESKRFTYWDKSKNISGYTFKEPTTKTTMSMQAYSTYTQNINIGTSKHKYLQQALVAEMGEEILSEYKKFSLQHAVLFKQMGGWDEMTSNLLLCGNLGFISSLHFDEQENLFAQLTGHKRVRIFAPHNWHRLYLYPNGHPCDRHAQLQLPAVPGSTVLDSEADLLRFPEFAAIDGEEMFTDLGPGEVLYIPQFWFHQMEGLSDGNVSLSWWFKHHTATAKLDLRHIDPRLISLIAVRRNLGRWPLSCHLQF